MDDFYEVELNEVISTVLRLNESYDSVRDDEECAHLTPFHLESDGYNHYIKILEFIIWSSVMDEREESESIYDFVKKESKKILSKLIMVCD